MAFYDRVRFAVSGTPGSGAITVGTVVSGFVTPATAQPSAIADATAIVILIEDGSAWEICDSVYTVSGTSLSRGTLIASSTGSRLTLTSAAIVSVIVCARDLTKMPTGYSLLATHIVGGAEATVSFTGLTSADIIVGFDELLITAGSGVALNYKLSTDGSTYSAAQTLAASNLNTSGHFASAASLTGLNVGYGTVTLGGSTTVAAVASTPRIQAGTTPQGFWATVPITALQVLPASSTFASGTIRLWGR